MCVILRCSTELPFICNNSAAPFIFHFLEMSVRIEAVQMKSDPRKNEAEQSGRGEVMSGSLQKEQIEKKMAEFQVAGISLGLLGSGRLEKEMYLGYADRERKKKISAATLYEAASLTKPVFAWYVHLLERQGFLRDDTQPLRELSDYPVCREKGADEITLMQILTHSCGLENWGEKPLRLLFTPGERFGYSGEGYTCLQRYVEQLRRAGLDRLFEREVYPRAHMQNSAMRYCDTVQEKVAMSYDEEGRAQRDRYQVRELEKEPNAAYTLYTNLRDYSSFLQTLWEDKQMLEKMAAPRIPASDDAQRLYWGAGCGVWLGRKKMLWHYGDNGNFKNLFFLEKETGDGMVYFSNSFYGLNAGFAIAEQLFEEDFSEMRRFTEKWE